MRLSLTWKITCGFLFIALIVAGLMALSMRLFNVAALNQLLLEQDRNLLVTDLATYYQTQGSWDGLPAYMAARAGQPPPNRPQNPPPPRNDNNNDRPQPQPPPSGNRALFGITDENGVVLIALPPNYQVGERVSDRTLTKEGTPIEVDGRLVGTVLTANLTPELTREEQSFIAFTNRALLAATAVATLIALILGILLTRTLTRPVRDLTQATQAIAQGDLTQQVSVRAKDELGDLAAAFNQMSADLAHATNARKQMTADIAHDLRSPLTVLSGYLESMQDGVLEPTPARLETMRQEIEHLQHLVTDLRTLSRADAGALTLNLEPVSLEHLLQRVRTTFQHQADQQEVSLLLDISPTLPPLHVDEERMAQVLGNLVNNSLRYTPKGGLVRMAAQQDEAAIHIIVQDSGKGISAEDLPHVFHRFYRGDKARHNDQSGMGLAIAKSLIEAHGGTIQVQSVPGQGTTFVVELMRSKEKDSYYG